MISREKRRSALVAVLALLGAVPVASGTAGIVLGPSGLPGAERTGSTVDSEYRFVNVFWLAAGLALWWSLRKPEQRSTVTRLVLTLASVGAGPRLLSWARTGAPHPVFRATLVLELVVVPLVLIWHARIFPHRSRRNGQSSAQRVISAPTPAEA